MLTLGRSLAALPREGRDTLFLLAVIGWIMLPHVGHLPWWLLLWYQLSEHPILLAAMTTISVLLTAFLLWRALRWAARRRLAAQE